MTTRKLRILILLLTMIELMRVTLHAQPTISQQPTNQVVPLGGTLTLDVTAGSDTPLSYQWFKDSRLLLGATNSTLTVANVGVINSGTYYVVVTNGSGMIISAPTSVAVGSPCLLGWGRNDYGQLGIGTTVNQTTPITVTRNVVAGAAGWGHSLFVTTDGKLWSMGYNAYGQLGNGTTSNTNLPINVASNVVAVAAGWMHSLFVTADGKLWTMGGNWNGQLGYNTNVGTMNPNTTPICVASNVVTVAAGENHSLFVKVDGTLWVMGDNNYGQLGNGNNSGSNVIFPVCVASNVVAVAGGYSHSLFVTVDGTLWDMGFNFFGQLGNGTNISHNPTPMSVASNVVAVAAGLYHSLFVTMDGTLWAMGYNYYGELGDGTTNGAYLPVSVASNVVTAAAGEDHSLFVTTDGKLWAMGYNGYGQLGNGSTSDTNLPVTLANVLGANVFPVEMAYHSLVLGICSNAVVTLGNLNQTYTGNAITITASTTPPGLTVNVTYNGFSTPPTNAGSYIVIGTISDPTYFGSATNTLVITPQYIINQPTSQVVWLGGNSTFTVGVSNTSAFTYQWQLNSRTLTNIITTVAGKGPSWPSSGSYSGDGSAATNANLNLPQGAAVDSSGNLFFADTGNNRIRMVSNNGIIKTVAGKGTSTYSGDGGSATNAGLYGPSAVALDNYSNLFIADAYNNRIRMVNTNGIITTVAGHGPSYPSSGTYSGDGGPATNASIWMPSGIAIDGFGNLFIADSYNFCIRKVSTNGIITTVAGNGTNGYSGDGNIATNAELSYPSSVALDASGNLFIVDNGNNRIREVSTNGVIQTVAGNGTVGYSGDNGPATNATFYSLRCVASDTAGNLFIADSRNNCIRKVDTSGNITTVAGNGFSAFSGDGGVATSAYLNLPEAVAVDSSGNLFIADTRNNRIRKVINTQGPLLSLYNVSAADAGNYQVIVTGPGGSITSSLANLTVTTTPLIYRTVWDTNSCITLNSLSKPGSTNVVQCATNLLPPIVWQHLSTNLAGADGKWNFTDTNAVKYQTLFYRSYEQ